MQSDELVAAAWRVRESAYAPYSQFAVGAALLAADGRIFTGCNVENISYGLTQCAERTAICSAVAAGVREFALLAVVADTAVPISPCGACRQVMAEFLVPRVILANRLECLDFTLEELLPRASAGILDRSERIVPHGTHLKRNWRLDDLILRIAIQRLGQAARSTRLVSFPGFSGNSK